MSDHYTLGDAKDPAQSRIASVLNISPDDPRFAGYINECQRRLLKKKKWWGTTKRTRMCVSEGCLTFPRQIATIEAISVCGQPLQIRNQWFEFLESGNGLQEPSQNCADGDCHGGGGNDCGGMQLYDRGTACAFADIRGVNKKIRVYADVTESSDSKILLQGYDENSNWIRTQVGSEWVDGEYVLISTTPTNSTKFFSALVNVQKPATNGIVRLYEYNNDDATQRALAVYEPDETRPNYRRSFIGGFPCNSTETKTVNVMAKLAFIPAIKDTDWLIIGDLEALKDEAQSILKKENNLFQDAMAYEASAVNELNMELRHRRGSGSVSPIRMQPRSIGGASVPNLL